MSCELLVRLAHFEVVSFPSRPSGSGFSTFTFRAISGCCAKRSQKRAFCKMARSVPPRFHRHLVKVDNCAIGGSHVRSQTSYIYRGVQDRARAPAAGIGQDHCGDRPGARHPCQCACPLVPGGTSRPGPGNNPGCLQVEADELVKLRRENGLLRKERDFLKSAAAYFARRFPIRLMARALEVSAAGYYAWARRPESARSQDNRDLTGQIRTLPSHLRQPGDHGGAQVDGEEVEGNDRLPAQAARGGQYPGPAVHGQAAGPRVGRRYHLLLDRRRLALLACGHRLGHGKPAHRGSRDPGITCSRSRKGNCWDNACVESFFGTLEKELVHHRHSRTREEARQDIFEWIEVFYNRHRRHSKRGYRSPAEFEAIMKVAWDGVHGNGGSPGRPKRPPPDPRDAKR